MTGRLTTHVLDTARGCPAVGIPIRLETKGRLLGTSVTNADGRCDAPLLAGALFRAGRYELTFWVAAYFARYVGGLTEPPFLDDIVLRFGIADETQHYHVPLLVSPYAYSTYRGS